MSDWVEDLSKNLSDLSADVSKMIDNEKKRAQAEDNGDKKPKQKRLRSLQKLTTFYANEGEAREASEMEEESPIMAFINKRMKDIF